MTATIDSKRTLLRYTVSVMATALAALGAIIFRHPVLALSPFLLFYAAVAVSAWFGGTGPGIVSLMLGASSTALLLLEPRGSSHIAAPEGIARLVLFLAIGLLIACLNGALRRANERCEIDANVARENEACIKLQQQKLQAMSSELMMAEERERRRIASVLHDAVVQMLALSKMKVDGLRRELSHNGVHQRLNEVYELIDRSISHTRTLTAELSPPVLYELGLPPAIQWLGDRLRDEHGLSFTLIDDRLPKRISDETRIVLFHAVRELLMNVVKHAQASRCEVSVRCCDSEVEVIVRDNGRGFSLHMPSDYSSGGFGLFNIRQRLSHLGGRLELRCHPGAGSEAILHAPLVSERANASQ